MAEHHYKFNVTMTCGGCSGAVERVLKKLDGQYSPPHPFLVPTILKSVANISGSIGVKSYNVSLDTQTADVTAEQDLSYEQVLEKIKKTGKTVNSGEADGVGMSV